jgi:hypothetical protein
VTAMPGQILSVVSASVDQTRDTHLAAEYEAVHREQLPEDLLASALM